MCFTHLRLSLKDYGINYFSILSVTVFAEMNFLSRLQDELGALLNCIVLVRFDIFTCTWGEPFEVSDEGWLVAIYELAAWALHSQVIFS